MTFTPAIAEAQRQGKDGNEPKGKHIMAIPPGRLGSGGESLPIAPPTADASEYPRPAIRPGIATQKTAALVLLTGLWVAISPRFLMLEHGGTNAAAAVISGLVAAAIGTLALVSRRGSPGLRFTILVLGAWVVLISSFILNARVSIAAPLYWSNTWSGAVLTVLGLAEVASLRSAAESSAPSD